MPLNDLLIFIEANPPIGESWGQSDWPRMLTAAVPDWSDLVSNPKNWDAIEDVLSREKGSLPWVLVQEAGFGLALRWFDSARSELQERGRLWFPEFVDRILPDQWNEMPDHVKDHMIQRVFDAYADEPFSTVKGLSRRAFRSADPWDTSAMEILSIVSRPYSPSTRIQALVSLVSRAGDKGYRHRIDRKINDRMASVQSVETHPFLNLKIPFGIDDFQARLLRQLAETVDDAGGATPREWPPMVLSFEIPPEIPLSLVERVKNLTLLAENDRLDRRKLPDQRERREPLPLRPTEEVILVEELLGLYKPTSQQIVLYGWGLLWCAKETNITLENLCAIVLLHEFGHWITHQCKTAVSSEWPLANYTATNSEVKEGWAQLLCDWICRATGGPLKHSFDTLAASQSSLYRVYRDFWPYSPMQLIQSLDELRRLSKGATLADWKRLLDFE